MGGGKSQRVYAREEEEGDAPFVLRGREQSERKRNERNAVRGLLLEIHLKKKKDKLTSF